MMKMSIVIDALNTIPISMLLLLIENNVLDFISKDSVLLMKKKSILITAIQIYDKN